MKFKDLLMESFKSRWDNPKPFPGLTPKFVKYLKDLRHQCRLENGGGGACHLVSEVLENKFHWERMSGTYLSKDHEVAISGHLWNLLPDGSILDTTADQTGEGHDIRVIPPSHPDYSRYRIEWSQDYNPGMKEYDSNWPSPHDTSKWAGEDDDTADDRIRGERGRYWWSTDKEQLQRYQDEQKQYGGWHDPETE